MYASYNYLYTDPVKFCSKFENIFKQNNNDYREIFHRSQELDLSSTKSCRSKGRGSKSKERTEDKESKTIKNAWL